MESFRTLLTYGRNDPYFAHDERDGENRNQVGIKYGDEFFCVLCLGMKKFYATKRWEERHLWNPI